MYSYNPYYETYLAHFGVKGMRWGVRKDPARAARKALRKKRRTERRAFNKDAKKEEKRYLKSHMFSNLLLGKEMTLKSGERSIKRNLSEKWGKEKTDKLYSDRKMKKALTSGAIILGSLGIKAFLGSEKGSQMVGNKLNIMFENKRNNVVFTEDAPFVSDIPVSKLLPAVR